MGQIGSIFLGSAFGNGVGVFSILVTIVLFLLQIKNQLDAYKERVSFANAELVFAVIKRAAVERRMISENQYEALRSAHQFSVGQKRAKLIDFRLALSCAFKEVLSNPFLDSGQRQEIIQIIEISADTIAQNAVVGEVKQVFEALEGIEGGSTFIAGIFSLLAGIGTALFSSQIAHVLGAVPSQQAGVLVTSLAVLAALVVAILTLIPSRAWRRRQSRNVASIDLAALKDIETGR